MIQDAKVIDRHERDRICDALVDAFVEAQERGGHDAVSAAVGTFVGRLLRAFGVQVVDDDREASE